MASVMFPDFLGAIGKASAIEANQAQRDWMDEDRAARKAAGALVPQALGGDREALNRIGSMHPDTAMKIAPLLERMDAARRAKVKEASEWTAKAAMGVLSLPPEQRPAAYQAALAEGQRLGFQIDMPPQYDRAVEGRLNQVINQSRSVSDYLKDKQEGFDLVPSGGGGGAVSGDVIGRTKQVIGGMESSNRYDAVGPDTGGGKRAYGKYGVMDFNIGPWTQEALGRSLTPQQFLASPEAQEAVADLKLGQYIKQYGSPEAAARAWFAGAGGMNNPGAKDVLGTSVQGYGQKFAEAFGSGATGPGPQVAQGDNTRADGSGTPIPTSDGGAVPRDAMRMITPNLPPGASLGKDRKTGKYIVQEGNFIVYDGNKNPIGMIPVPKAQGGGVFTGKSPEAEGLNWLIENGKLTPQQAAELAAGKTITNPADMSVIFMTPSGLFGQKPGQAPQPVGAPSATAPTGGTPAPATPPGMIPVTPPKPVQMTEGQSNAALYADRMREADAIISANEKAGMSIEGRLLEAVPGGAGNFLQADNYQLFEQARRNFINAVLRRESGAVIADSEFANAEKQYFPRPGDSKAVLEQKAANRRSAIEGIARAAGPAYKAPAQAAQPQSGADRGRVLFEAREAISKGADPAKVRERLRSLGIEDEP